MRFFQRDISQRTTGTYKSTKTNITSTTLLTSGTDGSMLPDVRMPVARKQKKTPRRSKNLPNMPMDDDLTRVLAVMEENSSRSLTRKENTPNDHKETRNPSRLLSFLKRGSETGSSAKVPSKGKPKISKSPSIREGDRQHARSSSTRKGIVFAPDRNAKQNELYPSRFEIEDMSSVACKDTESAEGGETTDRFSDLHDNWLGNVLLVPETPKPTKAFYSAGSPRHKGSPLLSRIQTCNQETRKESGRNRRAKVLTYNSRMEGPSLVAYRPSCPVLKEENCKSSLLCDEATLAPPITVLQATSSASSISVLEWTESGEIEEDKTTKLAHPRVKSGVNTQSAPVRSYQNKSPAAEPTSTSIAMMMMRIQEQSHSSITHDDEQFQVFETLTSTTSAKWDSGNRRDVSPFVSPKLAITTSSSSQKWTATQAGLEEVVAPPRLETATSSSSFHTLEWKSYNKYFDTPSSPLRLPSPVLKPTMSGSSTLTESPCRSKGEDHAPPKPQLSMSPFTRKLVAPETIEIAPGKRVALRGAEETMLYVATEVTSHNHTAMIETFHCCSCTSKIHGVNDAAIILCPVCQTVQPTDKPGGFGAALGFLPEDWEGWKRSLTQPYL